MSTAFFIKNDNPPAIETTAAQSDNCHNDGSNILLAVFVVAAKVAPVLIDIAPTQFMPLCSIKLPCSLIAIIKFVRRCFKLVIFEPVENVISAIVNQEGDYCQRDCWYDKFFHATSPRQKVGKKG